MSAEAASTEADGPTMLVRDLVFVRGTDATSWLQGQISQDLADMAVGQSRRTLVLDPRGRVESLAQVLCRETDEVVLVVRSGHGGSLAERLRRFRLRVRADLELVEAVPASYEAARAGSEGSSGPSAGEVVVHEDWPGLEGSWRLWLGRRKSGQEPIATTDTAFELRRVRAGLPELGVDVEVGMQPHETSLVPWTVSFDKGCFVGQELVARVDARGAAAPRRLVRAVLDDASGGGEAQGNDWVPRAPLRLPGSEEPAGHLTDSVVANAALALVARRVSVPGLAETSSGRSVHLEPVPAPEARAVQS